MNKVIKQAFGFEDVAIVPGDRTVNPNTLDVASNVGGIDLDVPIIASAMDSVVSPDFAIKLSELGGLAIINMDGLHTRYENVEEAYEKIFNAAENDVTSTIQQVYEEPIKPELIGSVIEKIKSKNGKVGASFVPASTKRLSPIAIEAGVDLLVVQSTVTTKKHLSRSSVGLVISELTKKLDIPVWVGNTVTDSVVRDLLQEGISGLLVGVGPGAACTSRDVLGVGMPQVTAGLECSSARDEHYKKTGKYVSIIVDGGIRTGGDMNKALVSGGDAVMIGSPFAKTYESPGRGFHWGMSTPHKSLPRGVRISVGQHYSLENLLNGPSSKTDGTVNLVGALKTCMGLIGATTIQAMHTARLIYAPSIKTEGKIYQNSGLAAI